MNTIITTNDELKEQFTEAIKDYPNILSVAQVIDILGISRPCAYRMIQNKQIPSIKIGGIVRILKQSLVDAVTFRSYNGGVTG